VADATVRARLADGIARLERARPQLKVAITLASDPVDGLDSDNLATQRALHDRGARFDLVNVMAMDFGSPAPTMASDVESAATETVAELDRRYPRSGGWWRALRISPMIGRNDDPGEVFTLDDARELAAFARARHVAQLGMWSVDRDRACAHAGAAAQPTCSGVAQRPFAFSGILRGG
jgi:chitinase